MNAEADPKVTFDLRGNSELGIEPDYVNFLTQGVAIDYAIIAPSNPSRFAPSLPLMDMPFVFRDLDHWSAVLSSDVLKPLEDELLEKADLMIIGYAGGGTRNLIANHKISNFDELAGHKMRVMGAPTQARLFEAIKAEHLLPLPIPKSTMRSRLAWSRVWKTNQLLQRSIVLLLMFLFAMLFAFHGIGSAKSGTMQTSTMLQVNMLVIYIAVPISGFFWALFSSFRFWQALQEFRHVTDNSAQ